MRALVTGADGFVGRHLMSHLDAEGDSAIGWDRSTGGPDVLNARDVTQLFEDVQADVVYHLAGDADVGGSWDHPESTFTINAVGTMHVLMAARRARVGRVLCVSSADVYGRVTEADLPLTEDAPLAPVSPYAASKVAADALAQQAFLGHGLEVIRVRPFNHLGPGQRTNFVAPAIADRIARNEVSGGRTVAVGNLSPRRDFTDVRDVVRAYRLLIQKGRPERPYNVCSGRDLAVQDLADQLLELATAPMELVQDPELVRPVDVPVLRGSNDRLREATGWEPLVPLRMTLADLLDDARRRVRPAHHDRFGEPSPDGPREERQP
jgi:GDP-4-dehydro-6-deoxy-D-mannose reductase